MTQAKLEFAKRLQAALEIAGIPAKPAVIEKEFNQRYWGKPVTLHAVRYWLRGESIPSHDKLLCLAEWLGVEPQTLRYGDEIPKAVRTRRKTWDEGIGYQEREIFELFLKLPVPQRKVAREVIVALAKANGVLPVAG
jgi:transcriptional regulator with XRE-family HTH domain